MKRKIVLAGKISSGIKWVTDNWEEMVKAHDYDLSAFMRGTLNVSLFDSWSPPDDEKYSLRAHAEGIKKGNGFLKRGNYLHPDIAVVGVGGIEVSGRLYFPAGLSEEFRFTAHSRNRLEIMSEQHIRTLLGLSDDEEKEVEVVLNLA